MIDRDALLACVACPRLAAFLAESRLRSPGTHSLPVPAWGPADAPILIVGLAPGFRGANRTGIPFCGDVSGEWLWAALHRAGLAAAPEPCAPMTAARITNAVKCCPPKNRPLPSEILTCRELWLRRELPSARVIVALGAIAHASVAKAEGIRGDFAHLAEHPLPGGRVLLDSYHPSPQNTRTGKLARDAFEAVFSRAVALAT